VIDCHSSITKSHTVLTGCNGDFQVTWTYTSNSTGTLSAFSEASPLVVNYPTPAGPLTNTVTATATYVTPLKTYTETVTSNTAPASSALVIDCHSSITKTGSTLAGCNGDFQVTWTYTSNSTGTLSAFSEVSGLVVNNPTAAQLSNVVTATATYHT